MSRYHARGDAPGSQVELGFLFVPNRLTNQLMLDEKAGIGTFGLAFMSARKHLRKGFTLIKVPNAKIKAAIKKRVWMDQAQLHPPTPPGESK